MVLVVPSCDLAGGLISAACRKGRRNCDRTVLFPGKVIVYCNCCQHTRAVVAVLWSVVHTAGKMSLERVEDAAKVQSGCVRDSWRKDATVFHLSTPMLISA